MKGGCKRSEEHYQTHSKEKYTHVHTHSEFWFGASSNIFFMLAQCSKLLPQICLIVSVTKKQSIPPSQWRAITIYAVAWARNPRSIQLIFPPYSTSNQSQSCLSTLILLPSPQPRPSWVPHSSPLSGLLTSSLAGAAKVIITIPRWHPINNFQIGFRRKSKLLLKTVMTWSLSTC